MSYAETLTTAGALTVGQLVRSVESRTGFARAYDPRLGVTSATPLSANLPTVTAVTAHSQHDDAVPWYSEGTAAGAGQTGEVEVQLATAAADVVNSATVLTFRVDAGAAVMVATG